MESMESTESLDSMDSMDSLDSMYIMNWRWLSRELDKAAMVIVFEWAAAIDIEASKFWKS